MSAAPITHNLIKEDDFYLKNWFRLFIACVLAYTPFIFNFIWGNHDWEWVKEYTPIWSGLFEGRFSQFFLQNLLFSGNILPVLTLLAGLCFFTASTILVLKLWNTPQKNYLYFLLGLNLVISPYTLSWLYFAFITLSCLSWPLFVICGYRLLTSIPIRKALPAAVILFTLALGGYPPIINLIFVIFFTLILNDLCLNHLSVKTILHKYIGIVAAICLSVIIFLIIQHFLKKYGLQFGTYNTASINPHNFAEKIRILLPALFKQFITTTSFISAFYKHTWLAVTFVALIILLLNSPRHLTARLLFFPVAAGLFCSPLLTAFAAQNTVYVLYEPRIDFFSLVYIYIYAATIIYRIAPLLFKNITTLLLLTLALYNIHTAAYAAKVWQQGFKAEANFAERFINRLENTPSFNPNQTYTFVQGGVLDFRSHYYLPVNQSKADSYTQTAPYIPWHLPSKAYKFYYLTDFFAKDFDIYWSFVNKNELRLTPELKNYLRHTSVPWPHANAIYLDNNTIILTLTPQGKLQAQTWIDAP